ncbi:hypothetical protein D3C86_1092020 [compost metagenome]
MTSNDRKPTTPSVREIPLDSDTIKDRIEAFKQQNDVGEAEGKQALEHVCFVTGSGRIEASITHPLYGDLLLGWIDASATTEQIHTWRGGVGVEAARAVRSFRPPGS